MVFFSYRDLLLKEESTIKINKFKKLTKGRYKIFLDKEEIVVYEDIILKHRLLNKKEISDALLKKILNENIFYEAYNSSLSYMDIKMRNKNEIEKYLKNKKYDEKVIIEVIQKLNTLNLLNEEDYVHAYINDRLILSTDGPSKIKNYLLNAGFDNDMIDKHLSLIEASVWRDKIKYIVDKRLLINKKLSKTMFRKKMKNDLWFLGYDNSLIDEVLVDISLNEKAFIKGEYIKAYKKYSKKYDGDELEKAIRNHLYMKGFEVVNINEILED